MNKLTVGSAPAESAVLPTPRKNSCGSPILNSVNVRLGVNKATSPKLVIPEAPILSPEIVVTAMGTSCVFCSLFSAVTIISSNSTEKPTWLYKHIVANIPGKPRVLNDFTFKHFIIPPSYMLKLISLKFSLDKINHQLVELLWVFCPPKMAHITHALVLSICDLVSHFFHY